MQPNVVQSRGPDVACDQHPVFPHLFTPFQIGPVTLRNRVAISAHFAGWWVDRGLPSDEFVAYLEERAKGGVGLLELQSHESFLHAQMLNPLWNTRTDEYGGSLTNRMRFLVETLRAMRDAIGAGIPLGVRLKLDDMLQRGMSAHDYLELV